MLWFVVPALIGQLQGLGSVKEEVSSVFFKPKPNVSCAAAVTRTCGRCADYPNEGFDCETPMRCVNCALRHYYNNSASYQAMIKSCYSIDEIEDGCNVTKVVCAPTLVL